MDTRTPAHGHLFAYSKRVFGIRIVKFYFVCRKTLNLGKCFGLLEQLLLRFYHLVLYILGCKNYPFVLFYHFRPYLDIHCSGNASRAICRTRSPQFDRDMIISLKSQIRLWKVSVTYCRRLHLLLKNHSIIPLCRLCKVQASVLCSGCLPSS